MKNKSLLIIILVSVVIFAGLLFSVYKVVTKDATVFYADGYVSVSDAEKSEKVYFSSGTSYKRGYGKQVIFKDTEDVKQEVGQYNFVFYNNKSINFLTDGVLLDLNQVNASFVPYYNIKSNYLIKYDSGKYVIGGTDKDIILDNFIGRINEQKYIVAGNNLRLKLSSSEEYVSGYYFELNFIDGQTVKIDNETINLETISDECYILVGENVRIDLSNQVIFSGDEAVINLDEIVINHDENIDILYEEPELEVNPGGGSGSGSGTGSGDGEGTGDGTGDGTGTGSGSGSGTGSGTGTGDGTGSGSGTGNGNGSGSGDGNGTGEGEENPEDPEGGSGTIAPGEDPEYEVETVIEYKNIPYVEFLSSNINSHKLVMRFNVLDPHKLISGPVTVRYMSLATGDIYEKQYENYNDTIEFIADGLRSNTDYIVTIYASYIRNNNIFSNYTMFQRTFSTKDLGISIEKDYVSSSEIAFKVDFDETATFTKGVLKLYDSEGSEVGRHEFDNNISTMDVLFEGLKSNTKYIAQIEELEFGNVVFTDGAAATYTQKTLKFNPFKDGSIENSPVATVNKKDYKFKFEPGEIVDPDKAIKKIEYQIYDKETGEVVKTIEKENFNSFDVEVDNEILKNNTTYYYTIIVTLNDNEKTIDYETLPSNDFNMDTKISPTMRFTTTELTSKTLSGYFTITDPDNTVDTTKSIYVEYANSLGDTGTVALEYTTCPESVSETTKCAKLALVDLTSDDVYTINLFGYVDLNDPNFDAGFTQIGAIKLMTEQADVIITDMTSTDLDDQGALEKFFELNINFSIDEFTDEAVKNNMTSFDIMLYEGAETTGDYLGTYHVGSETNIVEAFFDNTKTITLKDFGLTLEDLIRLHVTEEGQISKKYSIKLSNGRSGTNFVEFKPYSLTFEINDVLLGLTNNDATISVLSILNSEYNNDPELNGKTVVGLKVVPGFGNKKFVKSIDFKITDVTDYNNLKSVKYSEELTLEEGSIIPEFDFYFDEKEKSYAGFFRRGRIYDIEYTLNLDLNKDGEIDLVYPFSPESISIPSPVKASGIIVPKQEPSMVLFPWVSDDNSVTYKYSIKDVDKALPDDYKVYYEIGENTSEAVKTTCEMHSSVANAGYNSNYECVELNNLLPNDIYKIYLNPVLLERVETAPTRVDINNYTFEGVYSLTNVRFDLEALETGKSKYNNLVALKVSEPYDSLTEEEKLVSQEIRNRIAYYTVELTVGTHKIKIDNISNAAKASNIITYYANNKEDKKWNSSSKDSVNLSKVGYVSTCTEEEGTCIFIDYAKLYNSDTFGSVFRTNYKDKEINVVVNATYDTGKISYLGINGAKYAFQVKTNELIEKNGQVYNDNYLILLDANINNSLFTKTALGAAYAYAYSQGGFVDDGGQDHVGGIHSGNMYFINVLYSNFTTNQNGNFANHSYYVTRNGIEAYFGYNTTRVSLPIVAKLLDVTTLSGDGNFTFDRVVPSITVQRKDAIINGIKLNLGLSGYKDTDLTASGDGKYYVNVEVYDKETDEKIKTLKIDKNELTIQTGKVVNNKYQIKTHDAYKVDVTAVNLGGSELNGGYFYDYKTGVITFDLKDEEGNKVNVEDNTEVTVSYQVVIDGLNVGKTYYLKAYMTMNDKQTYLVDTTSRTYEIFNYEFTTKTAEEVLVTNAVLDTESETDYKTRYLHTTYKIDDIVGIDALEYKICNDDETICVNPSNYKTLDPSYNNFAGTYFTKNAGYLASIYHNISLSDSLDFIFNTNYNVVINALVKEEDGVVNSYEIYNNKLALRALAKPTLNVIKNAGFKDGKNAYLSFDISFVDNDRVISNRGRAYENGQYTVYLATKDRTPIVGTERTISVVENGLDKTTTIIYEGLDLDAEYNLMVDYKTYTNNAGEIADTEFLIPYLIFTLGDNGVAVGRTEYLALKDSSILRFGYATNMVRDYIKLEDGSLVPDPDQEAYVAGIVYKIVRSQGDATWKIENTLIFDDINKVEHKNDGSASGEVGENYYQITIPNTTYPVVAGYDITFQFYLGGNIASGLTDEALCKENSISNHWDADKNECYILSDIKYSDNTTYEGDK